MKLQTRKASKYENEKTEEILDEILEIFNEKLTKDELNEFNIPMNIILRFIVSYFSSFSKDLESQKKFCFQVAAGLITLFERLEKNGN